MTKRGNQVLFVYGSLKRGGRHHTELRGARFLGEAVTGAGYALDQLGEYLVLVPEPQSLGAVPGELFEVDDALLSSLDEFEGADYELADLEVNLELNLGLGVDLGRETARAPAEFPAKRLALAYLRRTR